MRGDAKNQMKQRYNALLKGLFLFVSCLTLLYFFVFTESYSAFGPASHISEKGSAGSAAEKVITSLVEHSGQKGAKDHIGESKEEAIQTGGRIRKLLPCGIPVGIYLETKGVLVTEVTAVTASDGKTVIPCSGLLEAGDYILEVNRQELTSKEQFRDIVKDSRGKKLQLTVEHDGKQQEVSINPVLTDAKEYIAGLWIRDNMHGIGTLTWLDEEGDFAALGHCISDIDTGGLMEIDHGQLYHAEIYSLVKGSVNQPGSLAGAIDYRMRSCVGTVNKNTDQGVFGSGNSEIRNLIMERLSSYYHKESFQSLWKEAALEVATADEIQDGKAQMLNCFNGECFLYDIEICKISGSDSSYENIDLEITVTDSGLLKQTGGILQGMSGSPIIQNGKFVGAVTHVFVNDPAKGYGIFIENMLENADQ